MFFIKHSSPTLYTSLKVSNKKLFYNLPQANWWADDWITRIYAPTHLDRLEKFTLRHIQIYGEQVRYGVNYDHEALLTP